MPAPLEIEFDLDDAVRRTIDELRGRLGRPVPDLERAVRIAIVDACSANAGGVPESTRDSIREDLAIQLQFPEEYVVFVDHRQGDDLVRIRREVKFHSRDLDAAYRSLAALEPEERERASLEYQADPMA